MLVSSIFNQIFSSHFQSMFPFFPAASLLFQVCCLNQYPKMTHITISCCVSQGYFLAFFFSCHRGHLSYGSFPCLDLLLILLWCHSACFFFSPSISYKWVARSTDLIKFRLDFFFFASTTSCVLLGTSIRGYILYIGNVVCPWEIFLRFINESGIVQ